MIYTRRESLKKKSQKTDSPGFEKLQPEPRTVSTGSDYEFLDDITNDVHLHRDEGKTEPAGEKSKQKCQQTRQTPPDLVLSNHDLIDPAARLFSQSLNSISCAAAASSSSQAGNSLAAPRRGEEQTSHSLPSSPHKNSEVVLTYLTDLTSLVTQKSLWQDKTVDFNRCTRETDP